MLVSWLPTPSQHLLVSATALLVYVLTTRARAQRRTPTAAIAWVLGLALLPYLTLPLYLLFGQRKLAPVLPPPTGLVTDQHWASELIQSFALAPPSRCRIAMHGDGARARDALWATLERAQRRLDVCTFIIGNDALGKEVIARLVGRAEAGVQVRVLLDGFGAVSLPRRFARQLRAAGVQMAVFRPLLGMGYSGPRNLRNHRKLVIADERWLWSGGRNLAAEYFLGDERRPPWLDLSFDLQGQVAAAAARQFDMDWAAVHGQCAQLSPPPTFDDDMQGALAQFLPSGPDQPEDTAQSVLIAACYRARHRLLMVTPYFLPDDSLRTAMRLAARRGVEVKLVLPARSNHGLADFVRSRAMRELAHAGVTFHLLPQMVHAKAVVLDDSLALCGSINLDLRSLLLNHEAAVVFYDRAQIDWLAQWIEARVQEGSLYRPRPPGLVRDIAEGLLATIAFQL